MMYVVTVVNNKGQVITQRTFNNYCDMEDYANLLIEISKKIEERKTKDITKILKKDVKNLIRATEIEDKFVIAEMEV
ncbi:hypothetical protein AFV6_gp02 [Betalipothrixvirus pozzuoliense]|uniref:Uncharacterized protein n=1 Tax=Betalipothrixvirus pozzuoliense TaxID=346882 RepID=A7WKF7_9VIRU|nr:hypothetical protein AFV6_gp02 [Acidianus filamentous virus 6]CAJ31556.1 conserved hypothetical protein [Acidianus filamentous virus 6]